MSLSRDLLGDGLRRMLRIRLVEDARRTLSLQGLLHGAIHGARGQEAVAAGACMALRHDDYLAGTHRSHHLIAKGASLSAIMAELLGRANGLCGGKGGAHLADFSVGSIGEDSIVGGSIPIATGAAMSARARGSGQVSLCFMGDGSVNQGTFHESLNMAAVWKLPVVYICENNKYAVVTSTEALTAADSITARAAAYGIPAVCVDGQDLEAVYDATEQAVQHARAGHGPSFIEALTYRFGEHAEGLPIELDVTYRVAEEVASWQHRDPIGRVERRLREERASDEEVARIREEIQGEVDEAVAFGLAGPMPVPEDAYRHVYASPAPVRNRGDRGAGSVAARVAPDLGPTARQLSYADAVAEAIVEEMRRDDRVVLMGEDLLIYATKVAAAEFARHADRVWDTPISENSFTGLAVGAAMTGLRPIVDLTIAAFLYLAADQIINHAAMNRYLYGGQTSVPLVIRTTCLYNAGVAAQHSARPWPMFMNVPGLKVLAPTSPFDAKGLLKAAVRDDDPVLIFEDANLWKRVGPVPHGDDDTVPIGVASIVRPGTDATVVGVSGGIVPALEAAERLAGDGISVEVIDPRTLNPLDTDTIVESVLRTGRLVVVDPAHATCSAASEIASVVAEHAFADLKAPVARLATPAVHIPFSPIMERPLYPSALDVVAAVRRQLGFRLRRR